MYFTFKNYVRILLNTSPACNASFSKLVLDFVSLGFFAQDFFWIISKFRSEWMSQSVSQSVRDIRRYRAPPEEELKLKI